MDPNPSAAQTNDDTNFNPSPVDMTQPMATPTDPTAPQVPAAQEEGDQTPGVEPTTVPDVPAPAPDAPKPETTMPAPSETPGQFTNPGSATPPDQEPQQPTVPPVA